MKKAILAAALLSVFTFVGAQTVQLKPEEKPDVQFTALAIWFEQLSTISLKWSADFAADPTNKDAQDILSIIDEQFVFYIKIASAYDRKGDDCAAQLRYKVTRHDIELAKWQISFEGKPLNNANKVDAMKRSDKLHTEGVQLKKEIEACFDDKKL
jgi:hypothetical protein